MSLSRRDHLTTRDGIPNSSVEALQMQALETEAQTMRLRRERAPDLKPRVRLHSPVA
jgi:hypothetical protein